MIRNHNELLAQLSEMLACLGSTAVLKLLQTPHDTMRSEEFQGGEQLRPPALASQTGEVIFPVRWLPTRIFSFVDFFSLIKKKIVSRKIVISADNKSIYRRAGYFAIVLASIGMSIEKVIQIFGWLYVFS